MNRPLHPLLRIATMTTVYYVKTGEQYLCPGEDGDIGLTPSFDEAEHFLSYEDAERAAHEHADPGYLIITQHRG